MAKKIDLGFDIPDDLLPPRVTARAGANANKPSTELTKPETAPKLVPTVKQPKVKSPAPAKLHDGPALTVRLSLDKKDYKALLSIAMQETEKTGKRCSITNLINIQVCKLIQKGKTNV